MSMHDHSSGSGGSPNWSRLNQWLLWIALAAAVAWLFFGHGEHLLKLAPFLLILACPLMHLFGHGHGGHGGHGAHSNTRRDEGARDRPDSMGPDARGSGHAH